MAKHQVFTDPTSLQRAAPMNEAAGVLPKVLKDHKLTPDEYGTVRDILERTPTMAELGVFSAMWSEHCSYKSSKVHLGRFPTTGEQVVVGPGENAGVVRISGKLCVAFKMESHNHPSYIEPYQGAATGVGGILRDVFCMGSRPIANLDCLRFGSRAHPRTPYLYEYVVKGIGDYGNCVGIPTVGGNISFDPTYNGNCLVNAFTVGVIHEDRIFKGFASGEGNYVIYLGSATGRDGIHGATMASDSFATADASQRTTVQVGDPFTEKLLLEATLAALDAGLVVGLQDMGAAGLTSSSFEMADRAGQGLLIDLDRVPVRTDAMTAYELLLSESQERMLMVIKPEDWPKLQKILSQWDLPCAIIGQVTNTGRVQAYYQGKCELDIPVGPVTTRAPRYTRTLSKRVRAVDDEYDQKTAAALAQNGILECLSNLFKVVGDTTPLTRQYDRHIGTRTVRSSAHGGAAVLWLRSDWCQDEWVGLGVSAAGLERYCRLDPRLGAAQSVAKCARSLFCAGAQPLAITDCLNYGNPEDPNVMWEFSEGVDGIKGACEQLRTPVVSGNVSFYNETDGQSIAPTPMIGMVGKVADVRTSPTAFFSGSGSIVLVYDKGSKPAFGGTPFEIVDGVEPGGCVSPINWAYEKEAGQFVKHLVELGLVSCARDVGAGGIGSTILRACMREDLGVNVDLGEVLFAGGGDVLSYFGDLPGAYILAFTGDEAIGKAEDLARRLNDVDFRRVGSYGGNASSHSMGPWQLERDALQKAFRGSNPC